MEFSRLSVVEKNNEEETNKQNFPIDHQDKPHTLKGSCLEVPFVQPFILCI